MASKRGIPLRSEGTPWQQLLPLGKVSAVACAVSAAESQQSSGLRGLSCGCAVIPHLTKNGSYFWALALFASALPPHPARSLAAL